MKKKVKRYGNTLIINFTKEDQEVYKIREGDTIELTDLIIIKSKEIKNAKRNRDQL